MQEQCTASKLPIPSQSNGHTPPMWCLNHLPACLLQEALLLRKALHLTCDEGQARILSPARFAVMCNASGCLLENLVLKSHQVGSGRGGRGGISAAH